MLNKNGILLLLLKTLGSDLKSFGLKETSQQERFINNQNISNKKIDDMKQAIEKHLFKILHNKSFIEELKSIEKHYYIICDELKKSLKIKSKEDEKYIDFIIIKKFLIPYIAITMAENDVGYTNRIDKGFSGGRFWYLPDLTTNNKTLGLPVKYIMKWWLDLCGVGLKKISKKVDTIHQKNENENMPLSGSFNTLDSWYKNKVIPSYSKIEMNIIELDEYLGNFKINKNDNIEEQFKAAKDFVIKNKKLELKDIIHELPKAKILRKVYQNESLSNEEKETFINIVYDRWRLPPNKIIQSRFQLARATQYIWDKLHSYFNVKNQKNLDNIEEDLILQFVYLYQMIYNIEMLVWSNDTITPIPEQRIIYFEYIININYIYKKKDPPIGEYKWLLMDIENEYRFIKKNKINYLPLHEVISYRYFENYEYRLSEIKRRPYLSAYNELHSNRSTIDDLFKFVGYERIN